MWHAHGTINNSRDRALNQHVKGRSASLSSHCFYGFYKLSLVKKFKGKCKEKKIRKKVKEKSKIKFKIYKSFLYINLIWFIYLTFFI